MHWIRSRSSIRPSRSMFRRRGRRRTLTRFTAVESIHPKSSGIGANEVAKAVSTLVAGAVGPIVQDACKAIQPTLNALLTRTDELSKRLITLDDHSTVGIDQAVFARDGLILRGSIALAHRHGPVVMTEKTPEQDGHSADRKSTRLN